MPEAVRKFMELRAIDPQQVLPRQTQLDIASQLFADAQHHAAADAYEGYLRFYPRGDSVENVHLILGIIYGRYLDKLVQAKQHLEAALPRLHADRDVELARSELTRITPLLGNVAPST